MRHIYVASSWRNEFQPDVVRFLRSLGHAVYDFRNPRSGGAAFDNAPENGFAWRQIGLDHATCTPAEYREILTTHPTAEQGFAADFAAMRWADTCVLVLPCGRSAHLEAGWFAGRGGKQLHILLQPTREGFEPELMYLMADGIHLTFGELADALGAREPAVA